MRRFLHCAAAAVALLVAVSPGQANTLTPNGFDSARVVISAIDNSGSENFRIDNIAISGVPEPSSIMLLCAALIGLGLFRRRRAR